MKPQSIGRVLGIGLRVAGRVAGQHLANAGQGAATAHGSTNGSQGSGNVAQGSADGTPTELPRRATAGARAQEARKTTRNVGRGISGFLKPFGTVGGKIWLEVVGAFFFLPVLAFSPVLWRTRASWLQGPDHRTFLAAAAIIVIFLYLGVSSFWRAARRR